MKLPLMSSTWEGSNKVASMMLLSNVILVTLLAISLSRNFSDHETTRLVPPYLNEAVKVGWNSADQEYLKSVGLYVATLTANVTPKNVTFVADTLSQLLTPRIYKSVRQQILALAQDPVFTTTGGSIRFDATDVVYEKETQKVFVIGQMTTQSVNSREIKPSVIEMKIIMENGRPWVDSMDHYDGNAAHTLIWLDKNTDKSKDAKKQPDAATNAAQASQTTSEVSQ